MRVRGEALLTRYGMAGGSICLPMLMPGSQFRSLQEDHVNTTGKTDMQTQTTLSHCVERAQTDAPELMLPAAVRHQNYASNLFLACLIVAVCEEVDRLKADRDTMAAEIDRLRSGRD